MWSQTYRELLREYYHVDVGMHSYGPCLLPGRMPPGTRVGNYCSLAPGIQILRRNHPIERATQHPLFYNANLGLVPPGLIPEHSDNPLTIGHDVWIGMNVLVTPKCRGIGNSAVIAAGSVVVADVPPYAIVGGVPAKFIRWRFPDTVRDTLEKTEWWLKPVWELFEHLDLFTRPATDEVAQRLADILRPSRSACTELAPQP